MLDSFEKAHGSMRSPTIKEFNNLPVDIKSQYANYTAYKTIVDNNNLVTRLAMKQKIQDLKIGYQDYTKGSVDDKNDFDIEADELISLLGVKK